MDNKALLKRLDVEIKKLILDSTYSARGHQQAGQFWSAINNWLGIPAAVAGSLLGVGAAGSALLGNKWITAVLAVLSVIASGLKSFLKPGEAADNHLIKGSLYLSIRNNARLLREVEIYSDSTIQEVNKKLLALRTEYDDLNIKPPRNIPRFAYEAAKKSIAAGESDYENDPLWETLK